MINELELIAKDLNKLFESISVVQKNIVLVEPTEKFKFTQKSDAVLFLNKALDNIHRTSEIINRALF